MIGDHEYINIVKTNIGNFYSGGILGAKQFFPHPPPPKKKTADLCLLVRKRRADLIFFPSKEMYP